MAYKKLENNKKENDKLENKSNNNMLFKNITSTKNNNKNIKYNIDNDKLKRIEETKKYSSYFGDSNNNVYFEIKSFNKNEKKYNKLNLKGKEGITKILNTRSNRLKMGNFKSFGVQSEALYIPKEK